MSRFLMCGAKGYNDIMSTMDCWVRSSVLSLHYLTVDILKPNGYGRTSLSLYVFSKSSWPSLGHMFWYKTCCEIVSTRYLSHVIQRLHKFGTPDSQFSQPGGDPAKASSGDELLTIDIINTPFPPFSIPVQMQSLLSMLWCFSSTQITYLTLRLLWSAANGLSEYGHFKRSS